MKLAEALLRRKELQSKLDRLSQINKEGLFVVKTGRKAAHEGIDDILAQVPRIKMEQVTHDYDWHAKRLRLIDAAIQQANWTCEIEVDPCVVEEYKDPYV